MWRNKKQFFSLVFILVVLVAGGLIVFRANRAQAQTEPSISAHISESALESQYGMRVNLLAVTGAGGFVDVRIKIVDGEKAKLLLEDAKNFPALLTSQNIVISAPADTKSQEIRYDNGGTMFIMYPNSGNAVTRGAPVNILFGDLALDPIVAK